VAIGCRDHRSALAPFSDVFLNRPLLGEMDIVNHPKVAGIKPF